MPFVGDEEKAGHDQKEIAESDHERIAQGRADIDIFWWQEAKEDREASSHKAKEADEP